MTTAVMFLLCGFIVVGCASGEGVPPSGGPPDREAPTLVKTSPVDATTNFDDDRVEITFSEGINESDVRTEVVVTPIPERSPTISVSGKTLRIEFREDLLPDRTYAVTVGGGIRDYAGNRLGTPVTVRFATGDVIDSGRIGGSVVGEEREGEARFVFGWRIDDREPDKDLRAVAPEFITPVSDNGRFTLEGLPAGTYRLLAVDDQRRDRKIDIGEDRVGVGPERITIAAGESYDGSVSLRLPPAPPDNTPISLRSASSVSRTSTLLRFTEPIDTVGLVPDQFLLRQDGREIVPTRVWRSAESPANVLLHHEMIAAEATTSVEVVRARDTAGNPIIDSTRIRSFQSSERIDTTGPLITFGENFPRGVFGHDTIRLHADEGVQVRLPEGGLYGSDTAGTRTFRYRLVQRSPVELLAIPVDTIPSRLGMVRMTIDQSAFTDLLGNRGDGTVDTTLPVAPTRQLGTLTGRVVDSLYPNVPHILLLTNEFGDRYRIRLPGTGPWSIEDIPADAYRLEAFRDTDGDGELDYGTVSPWQPAERSVMYPGGIRVRPRWTTTEVDVVF